MLRRAPVSEARTADGRAGEVQSALGAVDWLRLAATPTFAVMAVLTALPGSGMPDVLCSAASPLSGMAPMYVLMSLFHAPPWLKLVSNQSAPRVGAERGDA